MDSAAYDALTAELRRDITYSEGIGYPYEWDELTAYLPRLCAKYLEPDTVESMLEAGNTIWNSGNPGIQKARAGGPPRRDTPQINMHMEGM